VKRRFIISLTGLGISAIITQVILLREFLNLVSGNELVYGMILGNWFLLFGIGSLAGNHLKSKRTFVISQLLIAVLPIIQIVINRYAKAHLFTTGTLLSFTTAFFFSFAVLLPYCLISGALLTLACKILAKHKLKVGEIYFIDSIGEIIGGAMLSFLLIYWLNSIQLGILIFVINLLGVVLIGDKLHKLLAYSLLVLGIILFLLVDINSLTLYYPSQEILFEKNSPYGYIAVTKQGNQINFYNNGLVMFSTDDIISNEETVHYALSHLDNVNKVLLIGGGVSGTIKEIIKYKAEVDYVELDPLVIETGLKYTDNLNPDINIFNTDGRSFVKNTANKYDAVIIDLPDPSTAQLNRYYTVEFFNEVKHTLTPKGIISLSLESAENYLSREIIMLHSSVYNALRSSFDYISVIPGDTTYYIASNRKIKFSYPKVETQYIKEYYKDKINPQRIKVHLDSLDTNVRLNKDFRPISYFFYIQRWLSMFKNDYLYLVLLVLILGLYTLRLNPVSFSIFSTGFSAASLQMVILIGFQVMYGSVYSRLAMIITGFMAGLSIGSYIINRRDIHLKHIELCIIIFSVLIVFLLKSAFFLYPLLPLALGTLTGMEFPAASKLIKGEPAQKASMLYNADFIGAFFGSIIASVLLIPLIGLIWTCMIITLIKIISLLMLKNY